MATNGSHESQTATKMRSDSPKASSPSSGMEKNVPTGMMAQTSVGGAKDRHPGASRNRKAKRNITTTMSRKDVDAMTPCSAASIPEGLPPGPVWKTPSKNQREP